MIHFSQVIKRYAGGYEALKNISFEIEDGEMVLLSGHSGAGKSTLLNLIAGIERPTSGTVLVNGQNVGALNRAAIPYLRRNIGLIFQDHKLLFDRSVMNNVRLPLDIAGYSHQDAQKRARAALDRVGLLPKEKLNPIHLSGGEQQRVAIARAIVTEPSLLIADEPTGNLDTVSGNEILNLLLNQTGEGKSTVVMVTHNPEFLQYANNVLLIKDGVIEQKNEFSGGSND